MSPQTPDPRPLGRQILALAVPALGALVAEPLFLLADTAIIGRLGVDELAGAALGITVMHTVTGLMIFLAYSTTPAVARFIGAGRLKRALAAGRDGLWLSIMLGAVLAFAGLAFGEQLLLAMGSSGEMQIHAWNYLLWSLPGIPAILLVFAAVGMLRGMQDTKTPLVVAAVGFGANIVLNLILVHPLGLGTAGAALGTSIAQWGMAIAYLIMLVPQMRAAGVPLGVDPVALRQAAGVGSWMMLRTVSLRAAIVATVLVATDLGPQTLAAHQVAFTIFSTLAFVLDALAIAAQALIGKELGASRVTQAKEMTRTMIRWGLGFGVITGGAIAVAAPFAPALFTPDAQVASGITAALLVMAVAQPLAGFVFVLDGVLMGAGDVKYLAMVGLANLAIYLPVLWLIAQAGFTGTEAIAWLWAGFAALFMGARGVSLGLRARGERWMIAGEHR
ncbi:MATE family efflux transporter [Nesterenkonia halotolerans]|uniref:MATE family efflux protein n=1 Tax=Nesterenkonia halotolerans TaxID=225325 RepID=A0ABR9J7W7_9MICC|nr:MATE family efflux transporter [Nesterenkonia halotolerans]MBE1515093.1 putative MATE family efflux protein [Nesterenkonia halotolerans]